MADQIAEIKLTAQCFQWHWNSFPNERRMFYHIKNELDNHPRKTGKDRAIQLSENKAIGVVAGVADFCYNLWGKVAYIELKVEGGRQSTDQAEFQSCVTERGHLYFLVWSFEEFKLLIYKLQKEYGKATGK